MTPTFQIELREILSVKNPHPPGDSRAWLHVSKIQKQKTELVISESLRVVAASLDTAFGQQYAIKNPDMVASILPLVIPQVADYIKSCELAFKAVNRE